MLKGRVRLIERLGTGGFCSVWRGLDLRTQQTVAVKVLHGHHEGTSDSAERFRQEFELLSRLDHACIARAHRDDTDAPPRFFTLEYISGEPLQARLRSCSKQGQMFPLRAVAWICARLAQALAHAHAHNIVHRDLKPANIMVNPPNSRPFAKVLDFGTAKALQGSRFDPTTVGRVIGSTCYMSPEHLMCQGVDGRSDQFALAAVTYEMLTLCRTWAVDADGSPLPFHKSLAGHNSQLQIMQRIARGPRPAAAEVRTDLPAAVDGVLQRGMAIQPGLRFDTIGDFDAALQLAMLDVVDASQVPEQPTIKQPALPQAVDMYRHAARRASTELPVAHDLEVTEEDLILDLGKLR